MKKATVGENETRRVSRYMKRLLQLPGLHVSTRDSAVVGDVASLYMMCGRIHRQIEALLRTSPTLTELPHLSHGIGALWASVDSLEGYHRDLEPPLDRLHTKLGRLERRMRRASAKNGPRARRR